MQRPRQFQDLSVPAFDAPAKFKIIHSVELAQLPRLFAPFLGNREFSFAKSFCFE